MLNKKLLTSGIILTLLLAWLLSAAIGSASGAGDLILYQAPDWPGTPTVSGAGVQSPATIKVIRAFADTEIRQAEPDRNLGDELPITLGNKDGQASRVLLDLPLWDLPPNVTIDSAVLHLTLSGWYDYQGTERTITAYRVTSLWQEMLATWNRIPSVGEAVGSINVGTPSSTVVYNMDLTTLVRAWYDGSLPNNGILLRGPEGGDPVYRIFGSSETTASPTLEVTYSLKPATLTVSPGALNLMVSSLQPTLQGYQLKIANSGSSGLDWQATSGASWLTLNQSGGFVGAGGWQEIALSFDLTGIGTATWTTQIVVSSSTAGVQASPQTINVSVASVDAIQNVNLPMILLNANAGGTSHKLVALLVGITDYQYIPPENAALGVFEPDLWGSPLKYPENDVQRHYTILSGKYGQSSANQVNTLMQAGNSQVDILMLTNDQASLAEIQAAFRWLDAHEDENTLVIFAYSGHGGSVYDDNGDESDGMDEFIAPYDTNLVSGNYVNIIRDDYLNSLLDTLESTQVVVMLDSCNSGGLTNTSADTWEGRGLPWLASMAELGPTNPQDGLLADIGATGRLVMAASGETQNSLESGELGQGVFSYYYLMAFLDPAADTDHNGFVSVEEAFTYAAPKVDAFTFSRTASHQNPVLLDNVPGNVDLIRP
jgi:hypothetical protein